MVEEAALDPSASATAQTHRGRWVVGVDGSECSRHAALWAAAQAPGRATELQLATTWSMPVSTAMTPMSSMTTSASFDGLERSARATVDTLSCQISPALDIPVTNSVGQGGAAALLLESAQSSALLVVGSRGRGGFARLILGSTSSQCATHSSAPVVVVPLTAPIDAVTSLVVAFDGSPNSVAALRWAVEFASPGSTIDCVSVWDNTPLVVGADQFYFPDGVGLARERFDHLFRHSIEAVQRDDVEVNHHFIEGPTRTVLADYAAAADLLVMGARGHGAIGAAVLGSVSTWLLHHTERAMVVVPQSSVDVDIDGRGTRE